MFLLFISICEHRYEFQRIELKKKSVRKPLETWKDTGMALSINRQIWDKTHLSSFKTTPSKMFFCKITYYIIHNCVVGMNYT